MSDSDYIIIREEPEFQTFITWFSYVFVMIAFLLLFVYLSNYFVTLTIPDARLAA